MLKELYTAMIERWEKKRTSREGTWQKNEDEDDSYVTLNIDRYRERAGERHKR